MEDHAVTELRKVFPKITNKLGDAIWCALTGEYLEGTYRNIYLPTGDLVQGTCRYWGQVIADVRGKKSGDYLDFYLSHAPKDKIKSIERKLKKAGWKLADEGIKLDRDEKLKDEIVEMMSHEEDISKITKKLPKDSKTIKAQELLKETVGSIKPKKRGRPPKVKN